MAPDTHQPRGRPVPLVGGDPARRRRAPGRQRLPLPVRSRPDRGGQHLALHAAAAVERAAIEAASLRKTDELLRAVQQARRPAGHRAQQRRRHRGETTHGGQRRHGRGRRALLGVPRLSAQAPVARAARPQAVRDATGHPRLIRSGPMAFGLGNKSSNNLFFAVPSSGERGRNGQASRTDHRGVPRPRSGTR